MSMGYTGCALFVTVLAFSVAACGGGGSSASSNSPPATNIPPTTNGPPSSPQLPDPASAPALKTEFAPYFKVGAATLHEQIDPATHAADAALLQKHFDSITVANAMKADTIGVAEGEYDFRPADEIVEFAEANGIAVRAHTLVWHFVTPSWFFEGDRSNPAVYHATVKQRLENYITDVVTHFRGRVYAWDVVNEAASDQAGEIYRKDSPWYEAYSVGGNGEDYIEDAFRAARAADPEVKLFLNDYGTERQLKLNNVMAIVEDLIAKGVPIDGVGHQLHSTIYALDTSGVDAALTAVEQMSSTLVNQITELDLSIYNDPTTDYGLAGPPLSVLSLQANVYRELFEVLLEHDASIDSVTFWGISDAETWLDAWGTPRKDRPLLFDSDRNPKWAFWAVVDRSMTLP